MSIATTPRLLADVGGTNARFALEFPGHAAAAIAVLPCRQYATLGDAVTAYLRMPAALAAGADAVRDGAIAIANPVAGDHVRMTNHHWAFSIEALRCQLGWRTLAVVNDFKALAMALPHLASHEKRQIGGGTPAARGVIGLLGPGTGLGVSALVPSTGGWVALDSEGGHTTFSASDERELDILRYAWREFPHVSAERLLSGPGLELIQRALGGEPLPCPEIVRRALAGECARCAATIDAFCAILGTVAGNLAVTLGAFGGVYVGGGIVPRLGDYFERSPFRARFESKGRFTGYLAQIPTYVITAEYPCFTGVAAMLDALTSDTEVCA